MKRLLWLCALFLFVAGCAFDAPYADDATVESVSYSDPSGSYLTLYTMVNNRTGSGGHSALLINTSERVIFDPAGSFYADIVPERNDVLFGITPAVEKAYRSAHSRSTHHVVSQTIPVTSEQAEFAYRQALKAGPVAGAFCTNATSKLLKSIPGFEDKIDVVMFPTNLRDQVAQIPGVTTDTLYEDDNGDLTTALELGNAALNDAAQ